MSRHLKKQSQLDKYVHGERQQRVVQNTAHKVSKLPVDALRRLEHNQCKAATG